MFTRHRTHSEQFIPQVKHIQGSTNHQVSAQAKGAQGKESLTGIVRVQINHFEICTGKCLSCWVFVKSWSDMLSCCCEGEESLPLRGKILLRVDLQRFYFYRKVGGIRIYREKEMGIWNI